MTPLEAYHRCAARFNFSPTLNPPADLCAAARPYAISEARLPTPATRELLRLHREAQRGAADLFAAHPTPGQLAYATGLPIDDAHAQLSAYNRARKLKPPLPRAVRPIPAYEPPPPLDAADPIADYHARVGADPSIRFQSLIQALGVGESTARTRYARWCRERGVDRKSSPAGPACPWLLYALARLAEGFSPAEIAEAVGVRVYCVAALVKDP